MKKKLYELNLDNETFKKIKKHKKLIYLQLDTDNLELTEKSKVIINNEETKKQIIRKVKKIYKGKNLEELKLALKRKQKYIMPKNYDEVYSNEENIIGIEFKHKKKIFRKLFLGIFIILLLFVLIYFLNNIIIDYKNKKFVSNLEKLNNEKVITVIVDINPSIALKVKNGTVIESQCLDQDCTDLLNKMNYTYDNNLNNQKLDKVITEIYEGSDKHDYDTSNGITVSSSSSEVQVLVKDVKEVTYKHITIQEEENILTNSNVTFKENELTKEDYNNKLLAELRKDSDYNITYTCDIYNGEVKCYIKDFISEIVLELKTNESKTKILELVTAVDKFKKLLDKFDIQYKTEAIAISDIILNDGRSYEYNADYTIGINDGNNNITNVQFFNTLSYEVYRVGQDNAVLEDKLYIIPFAKVDLLTQTYDKKDVVCVDWNGDHTVVTYGIE